MSRCRCSDIDNCKKEISILEDAESEFEGYGGQLEKIAELLERASKHIGMAYDINNRDSFLNDVIGLDRDINEAKEDFQSEIGNRLQELYSELSDMEEEDEDYHSEDDDDDIILPNGTIV